jgi:hypothetical protein
VLIPYPLEPPPPLPPLDQPWEVASESDLTSGRRARHGGERVEFYEGAVLERLAVLGPLELRDRRLVALEEPLFVWEVSCTGPLQLAADVRFRAEMLHYERTDDGSRLWLGGESPSDELLVTCYGGTVEAREEGGRVRLFVRGQDRVRLAVVGAWSEEDREQTLRGLARKGVAGVVAQQLRHNQMLSSLGVKVSTPDPDEGLQVEFDKLEFDSWLHERRGGGRILTEPYENGLILLSLGLREPVRDTLRAPWNDPVRRRLFAAYAAWAGADDFVRRHWPRLLQAVSDAEEGYRTFALPEPGRAAHEEAILRLLEVADALGDQAALDWLGGIVGIDAISESTPGWIVADQFTPAMRRWRITPSALLGSVRLAPELPKEWPEMTLERLRIGDTSLDVRVKRRPSGIAVKLRVTRGPPIVVELAPRIDFAPTGILLDGALLAGPTVRFTAEGEVEAVWVA